MRTSGDEPRATAAGTSATMSDASFARCRGRWAGFGEYANGGRLTACKESSHLQSAP